MEIIYREMSSDDYDNLIRLWRMVEGVGLSEADSPEGIAQFLQRNPGLSMVAYEGTTLVGALMCGHDGRRGYLHHLAIHPHYRHQGIAKTLVEKCLQKLAQEGITKCPLFVLRENRNALSFWEHIGWTERQELVMMSKYTESAKSTQGLGG
ncbi:MAG: GNAT family N-acetyltransferase [Anaerolineae bacterium]|nr:GNAT family N-acetyltransferase [Anaerolineae bacterium]